MCVFQLLLIPTAPVPRGKMSGLWHTAWDRCVGSSCEHRVVRCLQLHIHQMCVRETVKAWRQEERQPLIFDLHSNQETPQMIVKNMSSNISHRDTVLVYPSVWLVVLSVIVIPATAAQMTACKTQFRSSVNTKNIQSCTLTCQRRTENSQNNKNNHQGWSQLLVIGRSLVWFLWSACISVLG